MKFAKSFYHFSAFNHTSTISIWRLHVYNILNNIIHKNRSEFVRKIFFHRKFCQFVRFRISYWKRIIRVKFHNRIQQHFDICPSVFENKMYEKNLAFYCSFVNVYSVNRLHTMCFDANLCKLSLLHWSRQRIQKTIHSIQVLLFFFYIHNFILWSKNDLRIMSFRYLFKVWIIF